jgi:hypothetical protein
MKKLLFFAVCLFAIQFISAQNLQLHYDFGDGRKHLTSTVEMFKPDQYGSTFFFVDMNYGGDSVKGVSMAYFEIARDLKFWEAPFTFHIEYNGGFGQMATTDFTGAYSINDAWLTGAAYSWNAQDFSKGFTLQALYKYIRDKHDVSFQLTGVWYANFFNNKLTFSGFADFWKEDGDFDFDGEVDTEFVFLSEPQLWFNATEKFSVGTEIELGYNFGTNEGLEVMPTLGAKYQF